MASASMPMAKAAARSLGVTALVAVLLGCGAQLTRSDDRLARTELLALLQTLNADLLSHDSATLTLERWCGDHRLADPPRILARRVHGVDKPVPDDVRARLAIGADEPVRYRRVQLACGEHVLSEADNWYVPARLTGEMNRTLDTTDEPFGKVVRPLGFQRRTLSAELLWSPLPAGWESVTVAERKPASASLRIPHDVLRHQAVLATPAQSPISVVVETYSSEVFAFGEWQRYVEQ